MPYPRYQNSNPDNSGTLLGAAALAALATGGYLGYKQLTKDKKTIEPAVAPVAPVAPKKDERSAYQKYMGKSNLSDFVFNKRIKEDGLGIVGGTGKTLEWLGVGTAAGLGLPAFDQFATQYHAANNQLKGKELAKAIVKGTGRNMLKNLRSGKGLLATALITGGGLASENRIKGLRRSSLPNAALDKEYYAAGTGRALGWGGLGAGSALVAHDIAKQMQTYNKNLGNQSGKITKMLASSPKKAVLAATILGLSGGYLGDSFNERK